MQYKIALQQRDEGVSASVPGLPGCWLQGAANWVRFAKTRSRSRPRFPCGHHVWSVSLDLHHHLLASLGLLPRDLAPDSIHAVLGAGAAKRLAHCGHGLKQLALR